MGKMQNPYEIAIKQLEDAAEIIELDRLQLAQ